MSMSTDTFDPNFANAQALAGDYDKRDMELGLADALLAFQAEMPTVAKTKTATVPTKTGGSYKYTYADLAVVAQQVTPLLGKHGLVFSSRPRRCDNGDYELVGVLRHPASGESDEGALPLIGRSAQEIGGSITYARRYLIGCMTGVITDDDDDASSRATQRTSHPTAVEQAQQRVQEVYNRYSGSGWTFGDLAARYESDNDKQIATATAVDLNAWADNLEAEIAQRGAQAAADGAVRALGAQAVTDGTPAS